MKKSGIFWLIVILVIFYVAYSYHWIALAVVYGVWHIIGIITHYSFKSINVMDYSDEFDSDGIEELFLEAPYLYTMAHLFIIGSFLGIWLAITNTGKILKNFNNKIDNFEIKLPKKEKKKSFSQYKRDNYE